MNGPAIVDSGNINPGRGAGWSVAGTGDFNNDGRSDILLQNGQQLAVWEMNGMTVLAGSGNIGPALGPNWTVAGIGDFNADGGADILLHNGSQIALWEMNGTTVLPGSGDVGAAAAGWHPAH
jgi:hypothetical protein